MFLGSADDSIAGLGLVIFLLDGRPLSADASVPYDTVGTRRDHTADRPGHPTAAQRQPPDHRDRRAGRRRHRGLRRGLPGRQLTGPKVTNPAAAPARRGRRAARAIRRLRASSPSMRPRPIDASATSYVKPSRVARSSARSNDSRASPTRPTSKRARARSLEQRRRKHGTSPSRRSAACCLVRSGKGRRRIAGDDMDLDEANKRVGHEVVGSQLPEPAQRLRLQRAAPRRSAPPRGDARQPTDRGQRAVRVVRGLRHAPGSCRAVLGRVEVELEREDLGEVVVGQRRTQHVAGASRSARSWCESRRPHRAHGSRATRSRRG